MDGDDSPARRLRFFQFLAELNGLGRLWQVSCHLPPLNGRPFTGRPVNWQRNTRQPGRKRLNVLFTPVGVWKIASLFCSRVIYCFCDRSTCYYCTLKYESFKKGAFGEKGCGGCNYLKSSANVYYHAIKCKWDEAKRTDLSIAWLGKMEEKGQFVWAHILTFNACVFSLCPLIGGRPGRIQGQNIQYSTKRVPKTRPGRVWILSALYGPKPVITYVRLNINVPQWHESH